MNKAARMVQQQGTVLHKRTIGHTASCEKKSRRDTLGLARYSHDVAGGGSGSGCGGTKGTGMRHVGPAAPVDASNRASGRAGSASPRGPVSTASATSRASATDAEGPKTMNSARRPPFMARWVGGAAPNSGLPTATPSSAIKVMGWGTPS